MAPTTTTLGRDADRGQRRLGCLARATAARRAAEQRRRRVTAELEIIVRRAEHGRVPGRPTAA